MAPKAERRRSLTGQARKIDVLMELTFQYGKINKQTTQVEWCNETRLEEITTGVTVKERKGWQQTTEIWLCPADWDDSSTNSSNRAVRRMVLAKGNGQKWIVLDFQAQRWKQPYSRKSKTPGGQVSEVQTSWLPGGHMREKGEKQRAKGRRQKLHKCPWG